MEQALTIFDIISFVSSIASLVLAIVAIWFSFKFFEKSNEASEKTNEASKGISSSVERLEKLFDKLYSDTFSVMKDTVSDMRKHLWSDSQDDNSVSKIEEEAEKKAESRISEIKKEISKELSVILKRQHIDRQITQEKIDGIKDELSNLFEKAISESRDAELKAREETLRVYIKSKLRLAKRKSRHVFSADFVDWAEIDNLSPTRIFREIESMAEEGILVLSEPSISGPKVKIELI